jgi:hypothetical protein
VKASPVNQALIGSPGLDGEILKSEIKPKRVPSISGDIRCSDALGPVGTGARDCMSRAPPRGSQALLTTDVYVDENGAVHGRGRSDLVSFLRLQAIMPVR